MYLKPSEIQQTREDSLHFLLTVADVYLDAGERFLALMLRNGRQALSIVGEAWEQPVQEKGQIPLANALRNAGGHTAALVEEAYEIVGDTHRALMQAMESQVRGCDRLFIAAIDRGARTSPWEGEIALNAVRAALQSAEAGLHSMTDTAIQAVEIAEEQVREAAEKLAVPNPKRATANKNTAAAQQA